MVYADPDNLVFSTAAAFINNSNEHIFLTGKAGTGKTTFLKYIRKNSPKNMVVVAPTGVAAINAGGTTIHSFFQLPFAPYLPAGSQEWGNNETLDKHSLLSKLRLTSERLEIMQQMELLVIDEISMVRCDVLDAIDAVLRHCRKQYSLPFGGVQVLYIGDLFQLPPVIKENEWNLLSSFYDNQYFFSSQVIKNRPPVYIELQKIYRQADPVFISILNKVRKNEMASADLDFLHSRYDPAFIPEQKQHFITLTTHNKKAEEINRQALEKLAGKVFSFDAAVDGAFYNNAFPAEESLHLKIGAQVMFLKNDLEKVRKYYNGKIGLVEKVEDDKIWVKCTEEDEEQLIEVKKETWKNIHYSLNQKTQQIEEEEIGSFIQFPLRLAWAITIHKSQGLTFENAIIDAGNAFAPGQVYVALSRCTGLEGIVLKSKINTGSLRTDERILTFCNKQQTETEYIHLLHQAETRYQQEIILDLFDFSKANTQLDEIEKFISGNPLLGEKLQPWVNELSTNFKACYVYGCTFRNVLPSYFTGTLQPQQNKDLQERLQSAAKWFTGSLYRSKELLAGCPAFTGNRKVTGAIESLLLQCWNSTCFHLHIFTSLQDGFSMEGYRMQKDNFRTEKLALRIQNNDLGLASKNIAHPELFDELKNKRKELSNSKAVALYMICGTLSLELMADYLPLTLQDLGRISGFGKIKLKQFGDDFLHIIQQYTLQHDLESLIDQLPAKIEKRKTAANKKSAEKNTKIQSLDLFREGKSILEIAANRNLSPATIENHFAWLVEVGKLSVDELVDADIQQSIRAVMEETGAASLSVLKEKLLASTGYAAIKWVIASEKFKGLPV